MSATTWRCSRTAAPWRPSRPVHLPPTPPGGARGRLGALRPPGVPGPVGAGGEAAVRVNPLARQAAAELLGTAGLIAVAVAVAVAVDVAGSGVAASRLSPSDTGLQLLENALVTGAGPVALILASGPISGGHFNPWATSVAASPARPRSARASRTGRSTTRGAGRRHGPADRRRPRHPRPHAPRRGRPAADPATVGAASLRPAGVAASRRARSP